MQKGKRKKNNTYTSIVFIPHSQGKVKEFRLSSFYLKGIIILAVLVAFTGFSVIFTLWNYKHQQQLTKDLQVLQEQFRQQNSLIQEKDEMLKDYKLKDELLKQQIKDFTKKYNELTNHYLSSRSAEGTARSGSSRFNPAFPKDLKNLKSLLLEIQSTGQITARLDSSLAASDVKLEKFMAFIPTLLPAQGKISSSFGTRQDPFLDHEKQHKGIDIAANYGDTIFTAADGEVLFSGVKGGYGYTVIVNHKNGFSTLYGHCSALLVKEGDPVKKGQAIAKVGSSGRSTGPHLHYEVRIMDVPVDPEDYLDQP